MRTDLQHRQQPSYSRSAMHCCEARAIRSRPKSTKRRGQQGWFGFVQSRLLDVLGYRRWQSTPLFRAPRQKFAGALGSLPVA